MNMRADALSRRADITEQGQQEPRPLLKLAALETCEPVWTDNQILEQIRLKSTTDPTMRPMLAYFQNGVDKAPADVRRRFQSYNINDGILCFRGLVFVPDNHELRRQILRSRHDAPSAGHQGRAKTLDLVARKFYWPSLTTYVHRYVDGCDTCQRSKPSRHAPYGLLQPIPAAHAPWKRITADFIVKLPPSNGYDAILVVVDKNTKLAHFISTTEKVDSIGTANLYLHHVWKHHGLPEEIISDRGPIFVSKFTRRLYELLRIRPCLTTAFHPQSDGQTERVNQILEQYLRMFTTRQQDDWADLLPIAEFAYNNAIHSATGLSPFYATYGYHPSISFATSAISTVPAAEDRIQYLQHIHEEIKTMLQIAGDQAKRKYDSAKHLHHTFEVGDKVLLRHDHISTSVSSKKLTSKFLGPYTIISKLSDVLYRLKLPQTLRIHDVFHISLLEKYKKDTIPGRRQQPPPPIVTAEGEIEWEVDKVLASRLFGRWKKLQYLVSWTGYGPEQNSWEPASNLGNAPLAVKEFHTRHPTAPT